MTGSGQTCEIVVEEVFPHDPAVIWRVLTTSELIAKWLMPNDFQLKRGHRFKFQSEPIGEWNGATDCVVLEVEPGHRLVYSWQGMMGTPLALDTVVTWTLSKEGKGTRLRMVHSGFRLPQNAEAFDAMSPGWKRHIFLLIRQIADELTDASRSS